MKQLHTTQRYEDGSSKLGDTLEYSGLEELEGFYDAVRSGDHIFVGDVSGVLESASKVMNSGVEGYEFVFENASKPRATVPSADYRVHSSDTAGFYTESFEDRLEEGFENAKALAEFEEELGL